MRKNDSTLSFKRGGRGTDVQQRQFQIGMLKSLEIKEGDQLKGVG